MNDLTTTQTEGESSRERFEAWFKTPHGLPLASTTARVTWEAWQAAERQALERAVQKCRAIENEYWDQFKRHPADSPLRGNEYVGGQSDGAGECANAIHAMQVCAKEEK